MTIRSAAISASGLAAAQQRLAVSAHNTANGSDFCARLTAMLLKCARGFQPQFLHLIGSHCLQIRPMR